MYSTNIVELDRLLASLAWDQEKINSYKKSLEKLDHNKGSASKPSLVLAYNAITSSDDKLIQTEINGWPVDRLEFETHLQEHWAVKNEEIIGKSGNKDQLLQYLAAVGSDGFIVKTHLSRSELENLHVQIQYKNLIDIADGTKYIYPIELFGSGHLETETLKKQGFCLPDRVVRDARTGISRILIHEKMEGHGFNLGPIRHLIETMIKFYNIPSDSIGFLDCNGFTPDLQSQYGTRGFFYPYWEYHVGAGYQFDQQFSLYSSIAHRLSLQKEARLNCEYRFVCLNRRPRMHRLTLTSFIHKNHDSKILWSFMPENNDISTLQTHFNCNADHEKLSPAAAEYFESLPKQIDIDCSVNDVQVNPVQFRGSINLVTETLFNEGNSLFFSEKIYKPLYAGQPFILVGNPGSLRLLKSQGYETFSPWIDERYDDIIEPSARMSAIFGEINRLCNMSDSEFRNLMSVVAHVCLKNYIHFMSRRKNLSYLNNVLEEIYSW